MVKKTDTERLQGKFFTPTLWANEAHKMITEAYGENWKEEYIVWDCACGEGSLTRDYKFKELYCSTLLQSELDTAIQNNVNPEAVKFQHDFLQDIPQSNLFIKEHKFEKNLPEGLVNAFKENRKILILINPPYGASGNMGTNTKSKAGIATNPVGAEMKADKIGASSQLYAQFMYKIARIKEHYGLMNINLCQFSQPLFLTGSSYKKFRAFWFNQFEYQKGMLFCGSEFTGTLNLWGCLFSIWKSGKTEEKNLFITDLKESYEKNGEKEVRITGQKTLYNLDDEDRDLTPDATGDGYEQWNNDAIVYSLFNTSSNQSSLRNITYKDKLWDIENEWFWMPLETIKELADTCGNQAVYDDCKAFGKERYVYSTLKDLKLSEDAEAVLARATELVVKSFPYRAMMNEEHPEYHLNSWDAGWYQVKKILKEYLPEDLKAFVLMYREFEDRMRLGVYKFGFLRK